MRPSKAVREEGIALVQWVCGEGRAFEARRGTQETQPHAWELWPHVYEVYARGILTVGSIWAAPSSPSRYCLTF